jgi:peptidoglycan/LPS O-acetylase OafA/YrhL
MIGGPAAYAVWAFFVLSGYLMTHVLRYKYGLTGDGLRAYAFNRFLRIFPGFWIACVIGAVVVIWLQARGFDPRVLNPAFGVPRNVQEWGFLATLLPAFPRWNAPVPVANALSVEVGFYLLMPFFAAHRAAAWFGLVFGFLITADMGFGTTTFAQRYAFFLPAAPAFALGALTCHYRERLEAFVSPRASIGAWVLHVGVWFVWPYWPWTYGLYTGTVLSAWVVLSLSSVKGHTADDVAGELSYPFYLLHTTAGGALLPWFGYGRPLGFAVLALLLTLVGSWIMVVALDRPLARWKRPPVVRTREVSGVGAMTATV